MNKFVHKGFCLVLLAFQLVLSTEALARDTMAKLALDLQFYPSFSFDYELKFREKGQNASVELVVFKETDMQEGPLTPVWSEKAPVDHDVWVNFKKRMVTVDLGKMPSKSEHGLDGVTIACKWSAAGVPKKAFLFWSPDPKRDPSGHLLVKAAYDLAWVTFKEPSSINFLESTTPSFDLGPPIKTVSRVPFRVRIYGLLNEGDRQDLDAFFRTIRPDDAVCLDLTNLKGISQSLRPLLEDFVTGHPEVTWVPSEDVKDYLSSCGVKPNKMLDR